MTIRSRTVATVLVGGLLLALPATAAGADAMTTDFDEHVRHHATMQHFDGSMNPGHHQGNAGYDEMHAGCGA